MEEREGEGELVKSEELYERLHCMKCNFVTSVKRKKVRIDGLRRYVTVTVLVLDYEETDVSTENEFKEGVTDGLNKFLEGL